MAHISRLTGLRDKMKLHSLRRGGQFVLVEHGLDRDTVRILIGHETDSRADLAYISIVSTINVQALTKELPTTDITNCPASVSAELRGRPRDRVSRLLSGSKRMTSTLNSSRFLRQSEVCGMIVRNTPHLNLRPKNLILFNGKRMRRHAKQRFATLIAF